MTHSHLLQLSKNFYALAAEENEEDEISPEEQEALELAVSKSEQKRFGSLSESQLLDLIIKGQQKYYEKLLNTKNMRVDVIIKHEPHIDQKYPFRVYVDGEWTASGETKKQALINACGVFWS